MYCVFCLIPSFNLLFFKASSFPLLVQRSVTRCSCRPIPLLWDCSVWVMTYPLSSVLPCFVVTLEQSAGSSSQLLAYACWFVGLLDDCRDAWAEFAFLYECITLKRAKVQNKWIVFCNKYGKYLPWEKEWELCCYGSSIHFHVWCTFLIFCMWVTSVKAGMSLEWLWPMCCCRDWSLSCLSLGLTKAVILQL